MIRKNIRFSGMACFAFPFSWANIVAMIKIQTCGNITNVQK